MLAERRICLGNGKAKDDGNDTNKDYKHSEWFYIKTWNKKSFKIVIISKSNIYVFRMVMESLNGNKDNKRVDNCLPSI
jgi:hypothetical protein